MASQTTSRPPLPPFTHDSAMQKVRLAEDGWNTRDPAKVALAYAIDSRWRNRSEFIKGRSEIIAFPSRKWAKELDYRLIEEMWAFTGNRIAVRFACDVATYSRRASHIESNQIGICLTQVTTTCSVLDR